MRLIIAPIAMAMPMDPLLWNLCTGQAPDSQQRQSDDLAGSCPHMLRPRKSAHAA